MAKPAPDVMALKLRDFCDIQTSSIAGSSDTDAKELAVKPIGLCAASSVVTTVTPVVKVPKASRSFCILVTMFCRFIVLVSPNQRLYPSFRKDARMNVQIGPANF